MHLPVVVITMSFITCSRDELCIHRMGRWDLLLFRAPFNSTFIFVYNAIKQQIVDCFVCFTFPEMEMFTQHNTCVCISTIISMEITLMHYYDDMYVNRATGITHVQLKIKTFTFTVIKLLFRMS